MHSMLKSNIMAEWPFILFIYTIALWVSNPFLCKSKHSRHHFHQLFWVYCAHTISLSDYYIPFPLHDIPLPLYFIPLSFHFVLLSPHNILVAMYVIVFRIDAKDCISIANNNFSITFDIVAITLNVVVKTIDSIINAINIIAKSAINNIARSTKTIIIFFSWGWGKEESSIE